MAKAKSDDKAAPNGDASTKGPSSAQSRRDKLASLETARKKEQRRRTIRLLVICVVLAVGLLAYPVYLFVEDYRARNATMDEIGTSIAAAGCDPVADASGHRQPRTRRRGHQGRPTTGRRRTPASTTRPRPRSPSASTPPPTGRPVETLVHNLEHGYTVVWYRDRRPSKQIKNAAAIAKTFTSEDYDPSGQVHRRALDRGRRRRLPGRQERRADPLDRRPEQSGRHAAAEGRPAGLHRGQWSGDQGVHDQVPVDELAGAQRGLNIRGLPMQRRWLSERPLHAETVGDLGRLRVSAAELAVTSATSSLIRSASVIGQTRVICGVCTMTVSVSPTTATTRPSSALLITRLSRASTSTLAPVWRCRARPAAAARRARRIRRRRAR